MALAARPPDVSQINVPPFKTVAIKSSPKLSSDQFLADITTFDDDLGVSQVLADHVSVPHPYPYVEDVGPGFI